MDRHQEAFQSTEELEDLKFQVVFLWSHFFHQQPSCIQILMPWEGYFQNFAQDA